MEGQRVSPPPMQKPNSPAEQLAPGQQVEGKVTRVTDFGAFVDIGAGRDGMIHISELKAGRVQKVTDVVKEGEELVAWIKDIDTRRNRISLTMLGPNRKAIRDLIPGSTLEGIVTRLAPYGAFVDVGVERDGMLHVKEMGEGFVEDPAKIVKPGQEIRVRVLSVDSRRQRVDLTMKPEAQAQEVVAEEPVVTQEDAEVPTFMELAMQRALERRDKRDRKERKRKERIAYREEQEDILLRTLERHINNR